MEYYIIEKLELINGVVVYTPVGYLQSQQEVDAAPEVCTCFSEWCISNINELNNGELTLSDHFNSHGKSYVCNTITTSIEGMGIDLITDTSILI